MNALLFKTLKRLYDAVIDFDIFISAGRFVPDNSAHQSQPQWKRIPQAIMPKEDISG